jgi:hypothetical protein
MSVVSSFKQPMKMEEHAVMPLAGGIMQQGYQCGMLWGAALAAGAQAYRVWGPGPQAETGAVIASHKAVEAFRARNGEINCAEIIELNWKAPSKGRILKFFLKGGPIGCFRSRDAAERLCEIDALSDKPIQTPNRRSLRGLQQKQMGASDLHTGAWRRTRPAASGSSGGARCAGVASGSSAERSAEKGSKISHRSWPSRQMDRFLESSDYEFECAKIVGRKFRECRRSCRVCAQADARKSSSVSGACQPIVHSIKLNLEQVS